MVTVTDHTEAWLERLRELVRSSAPATSLYLRGSAPGAGERDLQLRWEELRTKLVDAGASVDDIAAVAKVAMATPSGDHATVAFAAAGRVWLHTMLDDYDGPDFVRHGRWPHVVPLLRWQERHAPSVVAVVEHGHAAVRGYDSNGQLVLHEEIIGGDDEIELNAPGGWAQPRYQRRAVDSWQHNADQFARRIASFAAGLHPLVVLLAGDVREIALVRDRLPHELRDRVLEATAQPMDTRLQVGVEQMRVAVLTAARRRLGGELAAFDNAVRDHLAVEGAADVVQALDQGRVARLIVVDRVADDDLADLVTAAALDADSDITVAEPSDITLVGGVGATLRY